MSLADRLIIDDGCCDEPPEILYKYLPPSRIDILENGLIRLTQPGAFNDPFEGLPRVLVYWNDVDYIQSNFPEWLLEPEFLFRLHRKLHDDGNLTDPWDLAQITASPVEALRHVLVLLRNTPSLPKPRDLIDLFIGILSLSEVNDDLLMWAHYADAHQGFVIGLCTANKVFRDARYGLRKVVYTNVRPELDRTDVWRLTMNLTKGDAWFYEREWRLVERIWPPLHQFGMDALGHSLMLASIPPESIASVIIGARMSESSIQALLSVLSQSRYSHVNLTRACIHSDKFAVTITPFPAVHTNRTI